MRRLQLVPFALVSSLVVAVSLAQEEEADDVPVPRFIAFTMSDGSASSREVESALGRIKGAYEEKEVLFLSVNLATPGGRNQGAMLFHSLGLPPALWAECKKSPAHVVLVTLDPAEVIARLPPKENLGAALDKYLGGEEEEEEGCGCGD